MIAIVRLGLQLTVAGRGAALRSLSTGIGSGIAAASLLGALTIAGDHVFSVTSAEPLSATLRLFAVFVAVISLPVVVLLAVVSRLAATIRDRRLATLRLLGLSPGQVRGVAAVETAIMSTIGAVVGMAVFAAVVRPLLATWWVAATPVLGASATPGLIVWASVLLGVPLLAVLVSQAAIRGVTDGPLAVAHRSTVRPLRLMRLVPLLVGVSLTGWSTTWPQSREVVSATFQFTVSVTGIVLNLIGLVLVVPLLVSGVAGLLAGITRRPSSLVAARRLQMEPASTTRLAAGLLVGLFVISGAQCVVVAFENATSYQAEREVAFADPQVVSLAAGREAQGASMFAAEVERRGLGHAYPVHLLASTKAAKGRYVTALVGSCDLLREILPGLRSCSSTSPAWISPPSQARATPIELTTLDGRESAESAPTLSLSARPPNLVWDRAESRMSVPSGLATVLHADLFIPTGYRNVESLASASTSVQWIVTTEPGLQASAAVYQLHDDFFPEINNPWQQDTVRMIHGMQVIVWTVTAVVVLIGLAAFIIAAVDRAVERRREDVSLHVLGAPPNIVRSAQAQQILLPLVFGIPSAVGLGLLSGASLLAYGSALEAAPWQSVSVLAAAATCLAAVAGLATSLGVSRPIDPELLRRE